jgi:hypothetical protein
LNGKTGYFILIFRKYPSITELAKAEGVNQSYACRMLRLSLLAPSIVTAILDGRHDSDVMLKQVMKPLPVRWHEQLAALQIRGSGVCRRISRVMEYFQVRLTA